VDAGCTAPAGRTLQHVPANRSGMRQSHIVGHGSACPRPVGTRDPNRPLEAPAQVRAHVGDGSMLLGRIVVLGCNVVLPGRRHQDVAFCAAGRVPARSMSSGRSRPREAPAARDRLGWDDISGGTEPGTSPPCLGPWQGRFQVQDGILISSSGWGGGRKPIHLGHLDRAQASVFSPSYRGGVSAGSPRSRVC